MSDNLLYCVYLKCSQCGNLSVVTLDDRDYRCPLCDTKYKMS